MIFFLLLLQAITLTCLGLHYNSMAEHTDQHTIMLVNGTFVGFSIILVALFAGYMMNTPINKRLDLFFSLIGCAMFITCGVLILQYWNDSVGGKIIGFASSDRKSLGITKGSLSIVNGILFLVDVVFTFRD
jgi:hypothetical protein